MKQREKEVLKLEEDFKDTLENDLIKYQKENRNIIIKDIKLVGQATWQDKISGKTISENVFIVEKQIEEIGEDGDKRVTEQDAYYLGERCIGAKFKNSELIYDEKFKTSEPDKVNSINELLERTSQEEIENNSLNSLQKKEISEVLTAHLGRQISEDEVQKLLDEMDEEEIEELQEEKQDMADKDENDLSEKQTENIKVNGIQKADLNKLVDGKETLGKRLDLQEYDSLYVVYSDKVDEITPGTKRNNTVYSLVGTTKDGNARVLNDEFEMDRSVGNSANRETTKIKADTTATRDNKDLSIYTRKSNGMSIGCENNQGNVDMFLYQKTREENENVGIQIETSKTAVIPFETKDIMSRNKGVNQRDKVKDEIEEHTENDCKPDDIRDFDGNEETSSHEHFAEETLEDYVNEIYNYENEDGEELIKDVFTKDEIEDKFVREFQKNKDVLTIQQILNSVKKEMNADAEILGREHKL